VNNFSEACTWQELTVNKLTIIYSVTY